MNTKIIKFDLNKYKLYEKIKAKQGDTKSRFLLFKLLDGSIPFSLQNRSVRAYMIKPDGKEVFNDLIINNYKLGYCTLELTNQVLAVSGTIKIELMVTEDDKKLTSSVFELEVIKSINSEKSIVSTNEFTALLNGLASLSEYDNYKNEIKYSRGNYDYLPDRLDNLDSQLEQNTTVLNDNFINPLSYGAMGNGINDDTEVLIETINKAIQNNQSVESNKTYYVSSTITVDFQNKEGINLKLRLKPSADIGTVIHVKNGKNSKIDLGIYNGGSSTDKGVVAEGLNACNVRVRGYGFLGTLWNVIGGDSTGNKNVALEVDVKAEKCGRGINHGDGTSSTAFGTYTSVFERDCTEGSVFTRAYDITITHYENYFNQPGKNSLHFYRSGSIHISTLALGGKADYLAIFEDSVVNADKLFFINEDIAGQNTKGLKIVKGNTIFNSITTIGSIRGGSLLSLIDLYGNVELDVNTMYGNSSSANMIRKDGVSLNLPAKKFISYCMNKYDYELYKTIKSHGANLLNNSNKFNNLVAGYGGEIVRQFNKTVTEWNTDEAVRIYVASNSQGNLRFYREFKGEVGQTYSYSVYVKNNLAYTQQIIVNGLNIKGRELNTFALAPNEVKRFEVSGIMRKEGYFQIQFATTSSDRPIDLMLWREKIEVGSIVTDWSCSYDDLDKRLKALEEAIATANSVS